MIVVFNDVSIYGNDYDPHSIGKINSPDNKETWLSKDKRIAEYKLQLKEVTK